MYKVAANLLSTPYMPAWAFCFSSASFMDVKSETLQEFNVNQLIHYLGKKQKEKERKET